jgi:hypothetical protein
MANFTIPWPGGPRDVPVSLDVPQNAAASAPLVVLLHGTGGTIDDMADPATHPGMNFERVAEGTIRNRGWRDYPNVGYWSIGLDPREPKEGWAPFLLGRGFPVLNYGQIDNRDVLTRTTAELTVVLNAIEAQRVGSGTVAKLDSVKDRDIVLLGHSRGGILARQVLVDLNVAAAAVLSRIKLCITLHSPNLGSSLANTAIALAAAIPAWRASIPLLVGPALPDVNRMINDVLTMVEGEVSAPAFTDFSIGSPTLLALAAAEPVPGVDYFTFGGTRAVFVNVRGWAFTLDSAIPQANSPPFFWRTAYQTLYTLPPQQPFPPQLPFPETMNGVGDVLTAAALTRLPFSVHRDNPINHAEALWDGALKLQVVAILNRTPLPQMFIVECITSDSSDPGRAIDAVGGTSPDGTAWKLTLAEALSLADRGSAFFVRKADGSLVPLQRVRRRNGTRYLRALPGAGGPRLLDLPACP